MIKRIYEKMDLLEDLRLSLLNFSLAMIYIIHKILVLLKNEFFTFVKSIIEFFFFLKKKSFFNEIELWKVLNKKT